MRKPIEMHLVESDQKFKALVPHHEVTRGDHATFVMDLMKAGSFVPSVWDGEDSRGQAKYRLLTPEELVARCVDITTRSFAVFAEKDWTAKVPEFESLLDEGGSVGFAPGVTNGAHKSVGD